MFLSILISCGDEVRFSNDQPVVNLTEDDFMSFAFEAGRRVDVEMTLSKGGSSFAS